MFAQIRCRVAALVLVAGLSVAGCTSNPATESDAGTEPATVTAIDGSDNLHQVRLTEDAARRIGLSTKTVSAATAKGAVRALSVAAGAVLYDQNGQTWVYLQSAPLTFHRARVEVQRIDGDVALLRSGPPAGSVVATVGAAELRGAEEGVPGE
jgi:hypothetical protein